MGLHLFEQKKDQENPNIAEDILESAHARAEKIIARAIKKSEEIVDEMEQFRDEMKGELRPVFKQSADSFIHTITEQSKQFSDACNELIPEIKEKYMSDVEKTLEGFKIELSKELVPLRQIVDVKVQEATAMLKTRMDEEWMDAKKEIEEYKEQRKQQFAAELEAQISDIAKAAFGDSLTVTEHQQLVMKALEQAKQDGVFKS
jgi:F0F1-type ATP synthase membrane subunit b/b'